MFLKVNKLSSIKNQLPYEYYSLPYCRPEKIVQSAENLGEVLRGDRIENSLYQVRHTVVPVCVMDWPAAAAQFCGRSAAALARVRQGDLMAPVCNRHFCRPGPACCRAWRCLPAAR